MKTTSNKKAALAREEDQLLGCLGASPVGETLMESCLYGFSIGLRKRTT